MLKTENIFCVKPFFIDLMLPC